jgi:hypothetical protein
MVSLTNKVITKGHNKMATYTINVAVQVEADSYEDATQMENNIITRLYGLDGVDSVVGIDTEEMEEE